MFTFFKLVGVICLLYTALIFPAQAQQTLRFSNTPSWVIPTISPKPNPEALNEITNGTYYQVYDRQIRVSQDSEPVYYFEFAIEVLNQDGVEQNSQITATFNPAYESLAFHKLEILRQGQVISKVDDIQYSELQREGDLENLVYDGRLTANIIFDDIRVGDLLLYAYSITGDNPIFDGHFGYLASIEWSVPVAAQRTRLLWLKPGLPKFQFIGTEYALQQHPVAGGYEFLLEHQNNTPIYRDSEAPTDYQPWSKLQFTDFENWSEVVDWALPLYQKAMHDDLVSRQIVDSIEQTATTDDEKIALALKRVQDDIRYLV